MKSIDEMRAELAAAGYIEAESSFIELYDFGLKYFAPNSWEYHVTHRQNYAKFESFDELKARVRQEATIEAYAHLQREKQFQAMREGLKEAMALIEKFSDVAGYVNPPMLDRKEEKALGKRVDALKALLATLPDSD